MVQYALVLVYLIYSANVSLGSEVRSSIFGEGLVVRILLFMLRDLEYPAGSGLKRVDYFMAELIIVESCPVCD